MGADGCRFSNTCTASVLFLFALDVFVLPEEWTSVATEGLDAPQPILVYNGDVYV